MCTIRDGATIRTSLTRPEGDGGGDSSSDSRFAMSSGTSVFPVTIPGTPGDLKPPPSRIAMSASTTDFTTS